ncbi:hypothetical protein AMTR_s00024p00251620 [Amborella trichopoda]|uniref:Uncharacterized protein n=1 Tax=Amborella trichopoda TaxID=13333 RepID=W1PTG9_AMBTC|nr:hypothetical protein AMTR_s00024p00251620 [Amborella trichopoda]
MVLGGARGRYGNTFGKEIEHAILPHLEAKAPLIVLHLYKLLLHLIYCADASDAITCSREAEK